MQRSHLLGAVTTLAIATAPASASATDIHSTFDALWYVDVSYTNQLVYEKPASAGTVAKFRLTGSLPAVEFENGFLKTQASRQVTAPVKADATQWLTNPEGTSNTCNGGDAKPGGFAVLGLTGPTYENYGLWFSPVAAVEIEVTCQDSDGEVSDGKLDVGIVGRTLGGPEGSFARFTPTFAQVDAERWEVPIDIKVTGKDCPDWDEAYSVACTLTATGKLSFFRTSRREVEDPSDDLLAPPAAPPVKQEDQPKAPKAPKSDKPKLDRKARKLRASVTCEWNCDVGIGVFTHRKNGKPYVKPIRSRKQKIQGSTSAQSVTVPLSRSQLGSIRSGKGATVKVTIAMDGAAPVTETFKVKS